MSFNRKCLTIDRGPDYYEINIDLGSAESAELRFDGYCFREPSVKGFKVWVYYDGYIVR